MKTVRFLKPHKSHNPGDIAYIKNHAAAGLIASGIAVLNVKAAPVREAVVEVEQMTTRPARVRRTRKKEEDA
jgi:hypothetical protein